MLNLETWRYPPSPSRTTYAPREYPQHTTWPTHGSRAGLLACRGPHIAQGAGWGPHPATNPLSMCCQAQRPSLLPAKPSPSLLSPGPVQTGLCLLPTVSLAFLLALLCSRHTSSLQSPTCTMLPVLWACLHAGICPGTLLPTPAHPRILGSEETSFLCILGNLVRCPLCVWPWHSIYHTMMKWCVWLVFFYLVVYATL